MNFNKYLNYLQGNFLDLSAMVVNPGVQFRPKKQLEQYSQMHT